MTLPPGPAMPALLQTLHWAFDPVGYMESCAARYGPVFTARLMPFGRLVMIADPEAIQTVFRGDGETWHTATDSATLAYVVGPNSLLTLQEAPHLRQRRLLLPPFHGDRMRAYRGLIERITEAEMAGWPEGEPLALHPRMQSITLDVILGAVFGIEDAERHAELRTLMIDYLERSQAPHLQIPALRHLTGAQARLGRRLAVIDALLYDEIRRRRGSAETAGRGDILSLLLQARDDEGRAMSDRELRDELITLLLAGHETTATSLAWAFERLMRHPDALQRLVAEIDAGEDDRYVNAVVRETLRCRPVIPLVARRLTREAEVAGRSYPAGTVIAPCIQLTNHLPERYAEPRAFRPERFLDAAPDPYGWIPFGGGLRRCIGASFALFEMNVVLGKVLARFTLEPVDPAPEAVRRRNITLTPRHGARAVVRRRSPAAGARAGRAVAG